MYDYSLNEKERNFYVLKYYTDEEKDEIQVEFPKQNGRLKVFKNLQLCPENIKKLDARQEKQAQKAIQNLPKYTLAKNVKNVGFLLNTAAFGVASFFAVDNLLNQQMDNAKLCFIVAGALALTLSKAALDVLKSSKKVNEIAKLQLLQENEELLNSTWEYPNALEGIDEKTKEKITTSEKPFKVNTIDEYSSEVLNKIINNINVEQVYSFNYNQNLINQEKENMAKSRTKSR